MHKAYPPQGPSAFVPRRALLRHWATRLTVWQSLKAYRHRSEPLQSVLRMTSNPKDRPEDYEDLGRGSSSDATTSR
jgi:hypothetical protein